MQRAAHEDWKQDSIPESTFNRSYAIWIYSHIGSRLESIHTVATFYLIPQLSIFLDGNSGLHFDFWMQDLQGRIDLDRPCDLQGVMRREVENETER